MWDASKCDLCGDCLVKCRYVDYDRDRAVAEIRLLIEGKDAEILSRCTTCVACNDYCPTGADPSNLIFRMQEKIGTCPTVVVGRPVLELSAAALEDCAVSLEVIPGDSDKPALSLDMFRFEDFPEGTFDSRLFSGMTVVKGGEIASLVGFVHMGGESFVSKYAQSVLDRLAGLGKPIVYIHNEGFVLAHTRARECGFKVDFEYRHLFEYLCDYLREHRTDIVRLDKKVAYQANCATRWIPEYDDLLGEVFKLIGVERPGRKYEGEDALCCSAPLIYTDRRLAVEIQRKNFEDAVACGSDAIITSCPVCDRVLRRPSGQFRLPKIFITDLCRIALGEKPWPMGAGAEAT